MSDDITESAKAIQEVAKAAGKMTDAAVRSGGFIAKHLDASIESAMGMLADRLKFAREVRRVRLFQRFQQEVLALGVEPRTKPLPLGFALDAIEEGCLEEVDELQDLWARLLANAVDVSSGVEARRSYISVLKDLAPIDARCFDLIYAIEHDRQYGGLLLVGNLPGDVRISVEGDIAAGLPEPSDEVKLALLNLHRLGLLQLHETFDGDYIYRYVSQTLPGHALSKALKRRHV